MSTQKEFFRKSILEKRMSLSLDEINGKSAIILQKLTALREYKESTLLFCYVDFRKEASTSEFIRQSLAMGKRVAVPIVENFNRSDTRMLASEIFSVEDDLEKGIYGILEPKKALIKIIEPEAFDLVVVPGVVFDTNKNRIGYGAGYYDRFLKLVRPDCRKIGICFDLQLVKKIPSEAFDIALDMIISENGII